MMPTCAGAAQAGFAAGGQDDHRYSFRELPLTAAGKRRHQNRLSSSRDRPARVSLLSLARPELAGARTVPLVPHRHAPAGTYPGRGRRSRAGFVSGLVLAGGGQTERYRPSIRAQGWGGSGSGSALRLPRLDADGLTVETRASRRAPPPGSPRRVTSPAPPRPAPPRASRPGQGKDHVRPSAGYWWASPYPTGECGHPAAEYFVCSAPPVPGSRRASGSGGCRARVADPRLLASTLVAPTPQQGLAGRPGGAGKSRPPPSTSLVRHRGSRTGAPRTPSAPSLPYATPCLAPRPPPVPALRLGRASPRGWKRGDGGRWGVGAVVLAGFGDLGLWHLLPCQRVSSVDQPG